MLEKATGDTVEITKKKGASVQAQTDSKTDAAEMQKRKQKDPYLQETDDGERKGNSRNRGGKDWVPTSGRLCSANLSSSKKANYRKQLLFRR